MIPPVPEKFTGRVLVTGANGFVGRQLLNHLQSRGVSAQGAVRQESGGGLLDAPDLGAAANWRPALHGCQAVVHLAARVHVMDERAADPLALFRAVNVAGTLALARQAAEEGVQRFVFLSSIKVNGEETAPGQAFRADDRAAPLDPYGVSKAEAEEALFSLGARTGMEIVVLRPPLIYGPGVKGNLHSLMGWLARGLPLPLGAIRNNRRSLVALDNLLDLLGLCLHHPSAAGQVFLAGDGEDLSTTGLVLGLASAMGVSPRLLPVPVWMLESGAALLGRQSIAQRLCRNLQVDLDKNRQLLGWIPPLKVEEGLRRINAGA